MTEQKLPDSSELTKEDFTQCGWKEILSNTPEYGCNRWSGKFYEGTKQALRNEDSKRAKILSLLGNACDMRLTNRSRNEPFEPMGIWANGTTSTPDWFTEADINFLAEILDEIDDPMLKGRLADLVWLKKTPTDPRFAIEAIDSYQSLDLNTVNWASGIDECWKRALILAMMLRGGAGERLQEIATELLAKLNKTTQEDGFFSLWIAKTLIELSLGKGEEENTAKKLAALGQESENKGDFQTAIKYYELAGEWFGVIGQEPKRTDMIAAVAEGWAKQAESCMTSDNPSALAALGPYDKAIQTYREIPKAERSARKIDERIDELIKLHGEAGKLALEEMKPISTPDIDISEYIQQAKDAVKGKSPSEALLAFTSYPYIDIKSMTKSAEESLAENIWIAISTGISLTPDGRTAGKIPGIIPGNSTLEESEPAVWNQIMICHDNHVGMIVQGWILPALETLHLEHKFQEEDFIELAKNSPAVPPGRERLFGKAMFNGYEHDFATAIHLLTPQMENMVRYKLKSNGVITTNTNQQGIEDEKGLSNLVRDPKFKNIFGENSAFEIKALFCDHLGANLRNNISHGLLTDQECQSVHSVYAWWLGLKIVFRTYWWEKSKNQ